MLRFRAPFNRILLQLAVAAIVSLLALPASALAHAQLETTSPERDGVVAHAPRLVSFTFDESVGGDAGAVRVFDAMGHRVDDGDARHPNGVGKTLGVGLKQGIANGTYTATYRVVSADTHIVTGGFVFAIGKRSAAGHTVGQLLSGQKTGKVTSTAFTVARGGQYAAIGVGAGLVLFLMLVWLRALASAAGGGEDWREASGAFSKRLWRGVLVAALVGLISAVAGVLLQGAESSGVTFWKAIDGSVISSVVKTRFGTVWSAAALAWVFVAVSVALPRRDRPERAVLQRATLGADGSALAGPDPRWLIPAVPLLALILLPALAGHASVQHPVWLFLPVNLVHVGAMSLWLGGLAALAFAVPAATRVLQAGERTRLLTAVLERFSPLALGSVVALFTTGIVQTLLQVDAWSELLHTGYGRAVLIKIGLLLVLIGLGALNRQRTMPRLRALAAEGAPAGEPGFVLRRTLRTELAVIATVLIVAGALAGSAPAKDADTGPASVTSRIGPAQLSLDVDPATVGSNEVHIYLLNPKTGAQYDKPKELTVTASLPAKGIGPLPLTVEHTGPGHYTIQSAVLGSPGRWSIHLTARVSDFDEYERTVRVRVR